MLSDITTRLTLSQKETKLKNLEGFIANLPFCPDHRDKVKGLSCRQCEVERLNHLLARGGTIALCGNELEGQFASPKYHPITCANPAPWKITEMKINKTIRNNEQTWRVYIRGEHSIWFSADQCHIGTESELKELYNVR